MLTKKELTELIETKKKELDYYQEDETMNYAIYGTESQIVLLEWILEKYYKE